jgi:predicted Zn-dependent protease
MGLTADASLVANSLFYDVKSGDYLSAIRRFPGQNGQPGQSYAHWRSFPVRVRLPKESPESWQRALEAVIARWDQYVPIKLALPLEAAPVEVTWVNQLPAKTLAVTRLNIAHGEMRVIIYLLRPSYYPPEIPEHTLAGIFMHEVGHALGLFGHSDKPNDLMYPAEIQPAAKGRPALIHFAPVSTRDINTLKKIYESPAVPAGISLEQPLEWSLLIDR